MRLRGPALTGESRPWSDALALFSLVAPLFLLLADVLVVALPYRLRPVGGFGFVRAFGSHLEIGGLSCCASPSSTSPSPGRPGRDPRAAGAAVDGAGRAGRLGRHLGRRAPEDSLDSLPAAVADGGGLPPGDGGAHRLAGPRRGRQLVNWRYGVLLLVAAAAVQLSTFWYDATSRPWFLAPPRSRCGVAGQQRRARRGRGEPGAGLEAEPVFPAAARGDVLPLRDAAGLQLDQRRHDLLGSPTPLHLAALFLPPVLFACGTVLAAVTPRRSRLLPS